MSITRVRRVLVTGGAGFIGSHLVQLLLAQGDDIVIVDDLSTGRRENVPQHARVRFVHNTVSKALAGELAREKFDEIYHLAASVGVKLVVDNPTACIENNIHETGELVRFALTANFDSKPTRTLIASSSEVYGKSDKSPFREDDDVVYGPTTVFRWTYAMSKALDESIGLSAHKTHGLPVVITRFFNTVGPRQVGDYGMVLPRFVTAALKGEDLPVYGDGSQTRCFCDVRDVTAALPKLLACSHAIGGVFNVGSDRSISIQELANLVIKVTASSSRVRAIPYADAFASGFEDLRQRKPDLTRIQRVIGFSPTIPLERTIEDVARSLKSAGGRPTP